MKYLLFLGSSLLLAAPAAHAQLGLRAGGNLLRIATDSVSSSSRVGYQLGVFYQVPLSEHCSLVPEVQFSREHVHISNGEASSVQIDYHLRFSYLNLPIVVRVALGQVYLEAGPQLSWLVGGRGTGTITDGSTAIGNIDQAATERYRRFDAGPCLGVGVKLPAKLGVSVRVYQGLGNMVRQNNYDYSAGTIPYAGSSLHRQTLQVSLTYQVAAR